MDQKRPITEAYSLATSRVRKVSTRTAAARWNRSMMKQLQVLLDKDPEVNLQSCFPPAYLGKLKWLQNPSNALFSTSFMTLQANANCI